MEWPINIFIDGKPGKQGSKRLVPHKALMRKRGVLAFLGGEEWIRVKDIPRYTMILDADKDNDSWRKHVRENFTELLGSVEPINEAVFVVATFYRKRPKDHYTPKGKLSKKGRETPKPIARPDSFKMMRSVEDALTGLAWVDDSMITDHIIRKRWADDYEVPEGVHIMIWPAHRCPVEVVL